MPLDEGWVELSGIKPETTWPTRAKLGRESIIVLKTDSGLRGIERSCPHQQATMMDSTVMSGGGMIRCALHSYIFRLIDGKGVNCPGFRLRVFDIREDAGAYFGREVLA